MKEFLKSNIVFYAIKKNGYIALYFHEILWCQSQRTRGGTSWLVFLTFFSFTLRSNYSPFGAY